ncbi:MAG: phosphomannomutase [Pseudomonadota bacterium]
MAPKFGTSGLRGLVTELTDPLCAAYAEAFLRGADSDGTVLIGRDLRASSPRIAAAVAGGAARAGLKAIDCGVLPTPALALAAEVRGTAAVMVTGSHIPDDRNGLKFYTRHGEITKADETAITNGVTSIGVNRPVDPVEMAEDVSGRAGFVARYTEYFPEDHLKGLNVGIYQHSSTARDLLPEILEALGAKTVPLGRSDRFIPVDTEALDRDTRAMLAGWASKHGLDAIVSTDGDADRPMVADADGNVIPGDRLGPLTAEALGAKVVVTPVSSNTLVAHMPAFDVRLTRIGSPYVIAGMEAAEGSAVVGYEANGGFLTGFTAKNGTRSLPPLMTRDCVLPIIAPLGLARARGVSLAALSASLPPRFTAADRLTEVDTTASSALISACRDGEAKAMALFAPYGTPATINNTDGYRATFKDGLVIHLSPSGNAPECRVYIEAEDPARAQAVLADMLGRVRAAL